MTLPQLAAYARIAANAAWVIALAILAGTFITPLAAPAVLAAALIAWIWTAHIHEERENILAEHLTIAQHEKTELREQNDSLKNDIAAEIRHRARGLGLPAHESGITTRQSPTTGHVLYVVNVSDYDAKRMTPANLAALRHGLHLLAAVLENPEAEHHAVIDRANTLDAEALPWR